MNTREAVIISAARTPTGKFQGLLKDLKAPELGAIAIKEAIKRAGVDPAAVDEVIMGCVVQAGIGQAPARQAALKAGLPPEVSALTVNMVCGSGLRAVALASQAVQLGDMDVVVAGGMESMSNIPYAMPGARDGYRMGNQQVIDLMVHDGLWCPFENWHMGNTGEVVAEMHQITREMQDEFSVRSQNLADAARSSGRFRDEIVPVTIKGRKGDTVVADDEYIRAGVTIDSVSGVRPAFKKDGTVTAANASGLNDGAAALVVMSADEAAKRGAPVLARIASWASAGVDPSIMGIGPVPATRRALEKAGWSIADLDLIEANEAFAAQALSVGKELGWDPDKVNVNGGAIAIGHPIGASGARVLTTLLYEMAKRDAKKGLATLCIGGGMGIAMCVER